jgi:hypothetical protein
MWIWSNKAMGCRDYRGTLQEFLTADVPNAEMDARLKAHLRECALCHEAVETAALASRLVLGEQPPVRVSEAFVTRVMAAIREQQVLLTGSAAIWRPLELLASRVAVIASVVLLGLTLYLAEFAPARNVVAVSSPPEIGAGLPERPAFPASDDDVLISLAEMTNAF